MPSENQNCPPFSRRERIPAEKFSPFRKNLEKALDKPRTVCYNNKALSQGRACVFPRDHDKNGLVAQLVRALACHARGRGFEPHPSRHSCNFPPADLAHLVERDLAKVEVAGSSPVIRSIRRHSQAVRQRSAKPSSPVRFRVAPPKEKPPKMGCFSFGYAIHPPSGRLRAALRHGIWFASAARRSTSSLVRRRACRYSPLAKYRVARHPFIGSAPCRPAANSEVTRVLSLLCYLSFSARFSFMDCMASAVYFSGS